MARRSLDVMKAIEHEIAGEKAFSLGRVGAALEEALAELRQLGAEAARAATAEARAPIVAAYNASRKRAEELYYALTLQREAMGVKHHDILAATYPIPPKLK